MGGVRNGAAEEDLCWDLNPGMAAIWVDHAGLGEPRGFGAPLNMQLRKQESKM